MSQASDKINLSIKIAATLFILAPLLRIPLVIFLPQWFKRVSIDGILVSVIVGYFLIRRSYWARIFAAFLSLGAAFVYGMFAFSHYVDPIPQLICYLYMSFYACIFLFFLLSPVKQAFGLPPLVRRIGYLTEEETNRVQCGITIVAILLVAHGVFMLLSSDWLLRHGFPTEDRGTYVFLLAIEVITAIGLLFRRKVLGRVFGLLLSSTLTVVYIAIPFLERSAVQSLVGVCVTTFTVLFFASIFFT